MTRIARTIGVVAALICVGARDAAAQPIGRAVELVGSGAFIGGLTPVTNANGEHLREYGGIRVDGGFQIGASSLGLGGRLWVIGDSLANASGGDIFLAASRRLGQSNRTAARATIGFGVYEVEAGPTARSSFVSHDGVGWSAGIEHEFPVFSARLLVSADLMMPSGNDDGPHRGRPFIEFGLGSRGRRFQRIAPISGYAPR